jgi:UDP-N-acetylglucosamine 2-epimerase (non-hydrolysing)
MDGTQDRRVHCPRILVVVGARPNFMKIAPIYRLLEADSRFEPVLLHTGQHYDDKMSRIFFEELGLPKPHVYLGVGSGSHAEQTARVLIEFERVVLSETPDLILVAGDVNSTLACGLVAAKACVPLAHVEAGLRSSDRTMPEEINRILTDQLADLCFTPSSDGDQNLLREGKRPDQIYCVGNTMIDSLLEVLPRARALESWKALGLAPRSYAVVTLHRPSNVDELTGLRRVVECLEGVAEQLPVVFPVHPRTSERARTHGLLPRLQESKRLKLLPPVGYLEFLSLMADARLVLTDSGGIQEETTVLGVPCLTLRDNTERPITITEGTNRLVGSEPERVIAAAKTALSAPMPGARRPKLWDGRAAQRIVEILARWTPPAQSAVSAVEL